MQDVSTIVPGKIYVVEGTLSAGMEYPQLKLAVLSHTKTGASKTKAPKQKKGVNIKNISDLNVGDYVVHVSHGIGIFEGIVKRDIHGIVKDYIKIRYAGSDMLFVPVTQLDLVTKYIGGKEDRIVKLNKLNSAEWAKTRARVKKAVKDMADELIKLYAKREAAKDTPLVRIPTGRMTLKDVFLTMRPTTSCAVFRKSRMTWKSRFRWTDCSAVT